MCWCFLLVIKNGSVISREDIRNTLLCSIINIDSWSVVTLSIIFITWEDCFNNTLWIGMQRLKVKDWGYLWNNQSTLWAELFQGLADVIQSSDRPIDGSQIGKKIILPSSFTGDARYQHQLYQDAMAIVHWFGKPGLFITFTCNPRWKEIIDNLLEQQSPEHRPDIVSRVFKLKLQALLHDIYYGPAQVLGKLIALIYVIEWQKRGPPHAHILAIDDPESKPRTLMTMTPLFVLKFQIRSNFLNCTKLLPHSWCMAHVEQVIWTHLAWLMVNVQKGFPKHL